MRGKEERLRYVWMLRGITPAYAGKSENHIKRYSPLWDHPRVCGEKTTSEYATAAEQGSPPRMRGKGRKDRCKALYAGITPAYAGKSTCLILFDALF